MQKPSLSFKTLKQLRALINEYFRLIDGDFYEEEKPAGKDGGLVKQRIYTRDPEPATFTGLALHLGFGSIQTFNDYLANGRFAPAVEEAKLRIQAVYEKKLHGPSATGAIFALKLLGLNDKSEDKQIPAFDPNIKIEIIETGPRLAFAESEVSFES